MPNGSLRGAVGWLRGFLRYGDRLKPGSRSTVALWPVRVKLVPAGQLRPSSPPVVSVGPLWALRLLSHGPFLGARTLVGCRYALPPGTQCRRHGCAAMSGAASAALSAGRAFSSRASPRFCRRCWSLSSRASSRGRKGPPAASAALVRPVPPAWSARAGRASPRSQWVPGSCFSCLGTYSRARKLMYFLLP